MKTKICTKCKDRKAVSEFHKQSKNKDGLHYWCKKCAISLRMTHYRDNKTAHNLNGRNFYNRNRSLVTKYLLDHPCVDCGEGDLRVLDFDHVTGSKSFTISTRLSRLSWENILLEINKCQVRCANCHRKRHYNKSHPYPKG